MSGEGAFHVAARLAGGGGFGIATADKQHGYEGMFSLAVIIGSAVWPWL